MTKAHLARLKALHVALAEAQTAILAATGYPDKTVPTSSDTGIALGMTLGQIGAAKALVGRDIDDALAAARKAEEDVA